MQPYCPRILGWIQQGVEHGNPRPLALVYIDINTRDAEVVTFASADTLTVHDALLAEGLAEGHRWVPNLGWITIHIRSEQDLTHALWLKRLSYLRYALKTNSDPRSLLEHESEELHLGPRFRSLLEKFVPSAQNAISSSLTP